MAFAPPAPLDPRNPGVRRAVTGPAPAHVVFTWHAKRRALERRLVLAELAELAEHHDRRLRNPGEADWVINAAGVAIVYDWPDVNDVTTALVISAWRQ